MSNPKKNFKVSMRDTRDIKSNPNHHIWNNNGTWCIYFTIHNDDNTAQRIRKTLGTNDVEEARRRRDKILKKLMED